MLDNLKKHLPDIYSGFDEFSKHIGTDIENEKLTETYMSMFATSIDYGIMERSEDVVVIPGSFGWNDIGSWDSLSSLYPSDGDGNIIIGENIIMDSKNTTVYSKCRLVVALGIKNLVIVETGDAVLICHKNSTQSIKKYARRVR